MFRGKPACTCLVAWLPAYERELIARGVLAKGQTLAIYQLIGNAAASSKTHSTGGAFDLVDLPGDVDLWVARQMGADATWSRTTAQGFSPAHVHGVLRGCPHAHPEARAQISSPTIGVDAGWNGLARPGVDDGPRPLSGRSWEDGIRWQRDQARTRRRAALTARIAALLEERRKLTARIGRMREKRAAL